LQISCQEEIGKVQGKTLKPQSQLSGQQPVALASREWGPVIRIPLTR